MNTHTDIIVAGAGAAGLASALAIGQSGRSVRVIGKPDVGGASRTVALFDGSIRFLEALGVWERLAPRSAPLRAMRIVDVTNSLFRAPPTVFRAHEIGLDAFGWNIENSLLVAAMADLLTERGQVAITQTLGKTYDFQPDRVSVETDSGSFTAQLAVAADGRLSVARRDAGILTQNWDYPQVALTAILAHTRPHGEISTEFHTRQGPCTFVPLPGIADAPHRSSLVWMMSRSEARRRQALKPDAFAKETSEISHNLLGGLTLLTPVGAVPMEGVSARALTAQRLALVGEAAHVFPPIGAQGLNLGLRDAAHLAQAICGADDPGGAGPLEAYSRLRGADVASRSFGVDTLNRALLSSFAPMDALRGLGLYALREFGPLRRFAMREGVMPQRGAPLVMRQGEAENA